MHKKKQYIWFKLWFNRFLFGLLIEMVDNRDTGLLKAFWVRVGNIFINFEQISI